MTCWSGAPVASVGVPRIEGNLSRPRVTWASRVAFLVDRYDDDWDRLWWVRADANAAVIDGEYRLRAIAALRAKYPQYELVAPHGVVVGAAVHRWSGWRSTA